MYSPEKAVRKEIEKVQDWYGKKYGETFTWLSRYDKVDKHWSWQIIPVINGQERPFQFGVSASTAEGPYWFVILNKLGPSMKVTLTKAQAKYKEIPEANEQNPSYRP